MAWGSYQITVTAVDGNTKAKVERWTMPAHIIGMPSWTVGGMLEKANDRVGVHQHVADKMGLVVGSKFTFYFVDAPWTPAFEVTVDCIREDPRMADILINGAMCMGICEGEGFLLDGVELYMHEEHGGGTIKGTEQSLWLGTMVRPTPGNKAARLTVTASTSVYAITLMTEFGNYELVRGLGFELNGSRDDMAIDGLIEGTMWALRCRLHCLSIASDCDAVVNLLNGRGVIKCKYAKIKALLRKIPNLHWEMASKSPCAMELEAKAQEIKENETIVSWGSVKNFLKSVS